MYAIMKIYFDKASGDILSAISYNKKKNVDFDYDYDTLTSLQEHTKESIDLLVLEDGVFAQDFREGTLIGVDLTTRTPIFSYPNPEDPATPIIPEMPLTAKIILLEERDAGMQEDLNFIYEILGG